MSNWTTTRTSDDITGEAITKSRLENDMATATQEYMSLPGTLPNEIPHTSPIVWFGSSFHPFDHIFEEMLQKDPDLYGFVQRYTTEILSLRREVVPGDESDGAQEVVELVNSNIELLSGRGENADIFTGNQWNMMQAAILWYIWAGTSYVEVNYSDDWMIEEVLSVPMHKFGFVRTDRGGAELRLRSNGVLEPIPRGKFILARNSLQGYPWGYPLATPAYWMWRAKLYGFLDWALWLERWAKPVVDVEYQSNPEAGTPGADEDENKEELDRKNAAILAGKTTWGNGYVVHNDQIGVKLLNNQTSGGEQYLQHYVACSQALARLLLDEVTTSDLSGSYGSQAKARVSNAVSGQRIRGVAPGLSGIIEGTIFKWLRDLHLPGAPLPRYEITSISEAEWERLFQGLTLGLNEAIGVPKGHVMNVLGIREGRPREEIIRLAGMTPMAATVTSTTNDNNS